MDNYIVLTVLIFIAAISNAVMDISSENKFKRDWWNKSISWKNKWRYGIPSMGERFLGSSTIFVWLTDGWHMAQFIFHSCWQLAVSLFIFDTALKIILCFAVIKILFSAIFEIFYKRLR